MNDHQWLCEIQKITEAAKKKLRQRTGGAGFLQSNEIEMESCFHLVHKRKLVGIRSNPSVVFHALKIFPSMFLTCFPVLYPDNHFYNTSV